MRNVKRETKKAVNAGRSRLLDWICLRNLRFLWRIAQRSGLGKIPGPPKVKRERSKGTVHDFEFFRQNFQSFAFYSIKYCSSRGNSGNAGILPARGRLEACVPRYGPTARFFWYSLRIMESSPLWRVFLVESESCLTQSPDDCSFDCP